MDISQLLNTYVLLNLKNENNNFYNILLTIAVIYLIKNYETFMMLGYNLYSEYLFKKCTIKLEMKVQSLSSHMKSIYHNSNKVLGVIYNLKQINVKANSYTEVHADIELEDVEGPYTTQLIPHLKNFKIKDDLYISTEIISDKIADSYKNNDSVKHNVLLEYKMIIVHLYCYKNNINYLKDFVEECEQDYIKFLNRFSNNTCIYISSCHYDELEKYSKFNKYNFSSTKNFSNLFFEGKDLIVSRIDNYLTNSEKYNKLGIPHTLGFLFHGPPGTGKTSTIKAIANYTNRTIVSVNIKHVENVYSLIKLFNNEFITAYKLPFEKRLYVFEEIDCNEAFLSRDRKIEKEDQKDQLQITLNGDNKTLKQKMKEEDNKITVGNLLEVLDGIIEPKDRMCVFTTNHIESIDSAFLRPGRIDVIMEFKKLRKVDIQSLFKIWFNKSIPEKDFGMIKDYTISQAEFGKICFDNINSPQKVISKLITFQN